MADPLYMSQRPQNSLGLNINDVIEVIGEDLANSSHQNVLYGDNNNVAASEADFSTASTATTTVDPMSHVKEKAQVHIIEQPQAKALRFRYICEGRSAGSIPGVRSTAENKTFPAIKVVGYTGPAVVVVSCVTVDPPYRPHPHNLVGKDGCRKGVCTVNFNNENMECVFSNLGIQCVKKRDVEDALKQRDSIRVDPFQTGFAHRNQPQSIDLNSLRLCFQVFLEGPQKGKFTHPLKPVVSDPIYDKKATCDLLISKLSDCTSTVAGGKEVILLCDKVTKEDILVRFYEVKDGRITWEAYGDFQPSDVHKQVAISFKTPRYEKLEIENPVKVYVQLQRPSDKATSEPRPFEYLPLDSGRPYLSFKRLKQSYGPFSRILGLESPFREEEELKRKLPVVQSSLSPTGGINLSPVHRGTSGGGIVTNGGTNRTQGVFYDNMALGSNDKSGVSKLSPLWSDTSAYSDTDLIEEVLSDGSVNDILSGVGSVYQEIDTTNNADLNNAISNTITLLNSPSQLDGLLVGGTVVSAPQTVSPPQHETVNPDAIYGDASYASCYSNLQFVMSRSKGSPGHSDSLIRGAMFPGVPPKVSTGDHGQGDVGLYETPSSKPVHATKTALLQQRGFNVQIDHMDLETDDLLPKTVLDLFV